MTIKKLISENEWVRNQSGGARGMAQWVKRLLRKSEGLSSGPQSPCRVGDCSAFCNPTLILLCHETGGGDRRLPPTYEIQLTWRT